MLEIQVKRKFGNFTIDAAFSAGETGITSLFGPSGSGKTSIINMIAGLSRPDYGRIVLDGRYLFDASKGIDLAPEKRRVGYVFQDGRLFPHLSVKSNLAYGMRFLSKEDRYVDFDNVVELLGIRSLLNRRPARLSGGEKQRVAIGRALLCSPAFLLMDEPLASLDDARKDEILPFISKLSRNFSIPVMYVTHNMEEIYRLADNLVILDKGRIAGCGKFDELLNGTGLKR